MTTYSAGTSTSLQSSIQYGSASVSRAGKLASNWSTVNTVIIALLALQVLISFIGGLIRRG